MNDLTKEIINRNDSYIDALDEAIRKFRGETALDVKQKYLVSIGEIGKEVHRINKRLRMM